MAAGNAQPEKDDMPAPGTAAVRGHSPMSSSSEEVVVAPTVTARGGASGRANSTPPAPPAAAPGDGPPSLIPLPPQPNTAEGEEGGQSGTSPSTPRQRQYDMLHRAATPKATSEYTPAPLLPQQANTPPPPSDANASQWEQFQVMMRMGRAHSADPQRNPINMADSPPDQRVPPPTLPAGGSPERQPVKRGLFDQLMQESLSDPPPAGSANILQHQELLKQMEQQIRQQQQQSNLAGQVTDLSSLAAAAGVPGEQGGPGGDGNGTLYPVYDNQRLVGFMAMPRESAGNDWGDLPRGGGQGLQQQLGGLGGGGGHHGGSGFGGGGGGGGGGFGNQL
eukprot:Hpha_TRINITY_DN12157_c0_g1::TRINITY_DN12157_c0_g1_i1::g.81709::m.81709